MENAVKVHSEGNQIVLDFETLADALRLWKPWSDAVRRLEVTEVLHRGLAAAGLNLQLRVQGRPVADLGGDEIDAPDQLAEQHEGEMLRFHRSDIAFLGTVMAGLGPAIHEGGHHLRSVYHIVPDRRGWPGRARPRRGVLIQPPCGRDFSSTGPRQGLLLRGAAVARSLGALAGEDMGHGDGQEDQEDHQPEDGGGRAARHSGTARHHATRRASGPVP